MRRSELRIEHLYKTRFLKSRRLTANLRTTTLGASRESDFRLLGEDVSGQHAAIEFRDPHWVVYDLGSKSGTWVQKRPIVEHIIDKPTSLQISGHEIRLTPVQIPVELFFRDAKNIPKDAAGKTYHQVVVRKNEEVIETHLLGQKQLFKMYIGMKQHEFTAPTRFQWETKRIGDIVIQQRLVRNEHFVTGESLDFESVWNSDLRLPLVLTFAMLILLTFALWFAPRKPDIAVEKPVMNENIYTKMVFDAKVIKKRREESLQVTKQMTQKAQPTNNSPAPAAGAAGGERKLIKSIQAANLSQLIGKISKRASKNVMLIQAMGIAPDQGASTRAMSIPNLNGKTDGIGSVAGSNKGTFKLANVGTAGKGGGTSDYKGQSGLSTGNVGSAQVGIIEEESEVSGGLDKEVIANYIKSQLGQIRYCYERQLSANPDLYGKIQAKFVIGPEGAVVQSSIGSTTLNNAMVEGCILRRIASWRFPIPKGGTSVIVTYPFLFKSTN